MNTHENNSESISIVIPAYNEEKGIGVTLEDLCNLMPSAEIIVVDDGSTDDTSGVVKKYPSVICLKHDFNRGYGAALKTGMRYANGEYVAWFDADNQHAAKDLGVMLERIKSENIAAIIGERKKMPVTPLRFWGKWLISSLARTFNVEVGKDINCGLRIFRKDLILRYLQLLPNGYSASVTSTMVMLERGYHIAFQQVESSKGLTPSKVKLIDGLNTLIIVLRTVMLFAPLRIFLSIGTLLILSGLIYGGIVYYFNRLGIPLASVLIIIVGAMVWLFGLVADQISQMRLSQFDVSTYKVIQDNKSKSTGSSQ